MERYKYRAINENGRHIRGVVSAANERDLYSQLQSAGLELIDCRMLNAESKSPFAGLGGKRVKIRDLIQFFVHMEQMQSAGVPLLDSLADIRDTTENTRMRDMMSEIYRDVSDGGSLSESLAKHPKVFHNLYISLIKAGEDTGDLTSSYLQLVKYLKWVADMQSKIKKAMTYPIIVLVVVLVTIVVMMGIVVPQIVDFIRNMDRELGFVTTSLIATSDFFKNPLFHIFSLPVPGGVIVLITPLVFFAVIHTMSSLSDDFAYRVDAVKLRLPVFGVLIRKISVARYCQTFGALFASGVDIIGALRSSRETVTNLVLLEAMERVEKHVQSGSPLSEAFNYSGEFPSMVVRMLKIGEESGNLTVVLEQVSEFYTKDVDEMVAAMIAIIEPTLTALLGIIILWIAAGVFGPIYAMIGELQI
ncbi:MAG: type II secretion system F family protein [Alphaproteobacteria bacterium]